MSEQVKKLFFVFDVESVGLHGEGYAYGFVVVNEKGIELDSGRCSCNPNCASGDASGRHWIAMNCPELEMNEPTPKAVRVRFAQEWEEWNSNGAIMVADCPWPVESRFLNDCIRDLQMPGPYPLIDVGSVVLAAGGDPVGTFDRLSNELPKHDPLADARQSARILIQHLAPIDRLKVAAEALVNRIIAANDLHAVFTIKDSDEFKALTAALAPEAGK